MSTTSEVIPLALRSEQFRIRKPDEQASNERIAHPGESFF